MKGGKPIRGDRIHVKRIVLYGLSANPPTLAHSNIIEQLADKYDAVFVWAATNPDKINTEHKDYDPLYKNSEIRSGFLSKILKCNTNGEHPEKKIKVDVERYYDAVFTGLSVQKFIDANLNVSDPITDTNSITFKQYKLKAEHSGNNDIQFLNNKCKITQDDSVELWVCFGTDVVEATPNWGPDNVFLTKATGITMISRQGGNADTGLFSMASTNKINGTNFFKMPFFDWFPLPSRNKRADISYDSFQELNADKSMKQLLDELGTKGDLKKLNVTEWDDRFLLLIDVLDITLPTEFANTSSTKIRNLAIQHELGGLVVDDSNPEMLKIKNMVDPKILDSIYKTYGSPTIAEQLAIIRKKDMPLYTELFETKNADAIKSAVLEIMKV
jgi:hypothetical protein